MHFMRCGEPGKERPFVVSGGIGYDLSGLVSDIDARFWDSPGVDGVRAALAAGSLPVADLSGLRVGAPVARPGAVICIGQNYVAHAAETGSPPPVDPIIFFKHPGTVIGPDDDVRIPKGSQKTDWEVELCVVMGRTARYTSSPAEALACVGGYAIANDVSERAFQMERSHGQWSKGKCCETFNPLGPWLVPADEIPDPQALRLRSWVNGELRQDSSTADMIFSVAVIIHELSQYMVLEPGDIVNTGTPQGVALSGRFPYLRAGDVMELEVEGLGRQRQLLVPAP